MLKATGFRLLVKPDPIEEVTNAGIVLILDEREKKATNTGVVVDVGPIAWKAFQPYEGPWAKVGDKIHYARYAGSFIKDEDGTEYLILNDDDVKAIETTGEV